MITDSLKQQAKNMSSSLSAELISAYQQTDYVVLLTGQKFVLRINEYSESLKDLHARFDATSSTFITAHNPRGEIVALAQNSSRHDQLENDLKMTGSIIVPGIGQDPGKQWPEEPSFLVIGLTQNQACELGKRYEQNAIVYSAQDAIPKLILLR